MYVCVCMCIFMFALALDASLTFFVRWGQRGSSWSVGLPLVSWALGATWQLLVSWAPATPPGERACPG